MPSYIRPLCEGHFALRALMQSALPLLNNAVASQAGSSFRVWGSRSALSCHQRDHTSHRAAGYLPEVFSVHRPVVVGTANPANLSKALAHLGGQFLCQTAVGLGRLSGAVL